MRLLTCVLLLGAGALVLGCIENDLGEEGCWPEPNLCQIVCQGSEPAGCSLLGVGPATVSPTVSPTDPPGPTAPPKSSELDDFCDSTQITVPSTMVDMTKDVCETACSNQDGKKNGRRCRYWRYDEDAYASTKTCSLMKDGQCTVFKPCAQGSHDSHCYIGDLGCPDEEGPPIEEGKRCAAPIEYVRDHVHWSCVDTSEGGLVSAYDPAIKDLPQGTVCTTTHKCSTWDNVVDVNVNLYRQLQVTCEESGGVGMWVFNPVAGGKDDDYIDVLGTVPVLTTPSTEYKVMGEDILDGTKAIKEPFCTGGGVTLRIPKENIQQPGVQLVCDTNVIPGDTNFDILAPNTCLLLCDYQLGMTIESVWKDEIEGDAGGDVGDVAFMNENGVFDPVSQDDPLIQDGTDVKCW